MNNFTNEVKNQKTQSTETAYIYILSHVSDALVKVGETAVCPASREKDYIRKYELKGFSLKRTFEVAPGERKNIEKRAHQILKRFHVSGIDRAREIFACSLEEATGAVQTAIAQNIENQKFETEKAERRRLAERKRKLEMQKQKALKELQKRAEEAWGESKVRKKWDQKIKTFEKDFPLKKRVGIRFEPSRFRFNLVVGVWMFWGSFFPILSLAPVDISGPLLPLTVFIIYLVVTLKVGGAFERSNSEITDEKNTQKFKSLNDDLASVKRDFIRTWKLSNKSTIRRPSNENCTDMPQTLAGII